MHFSGKFFPSYNPPSYFRQFVNAVKERLIPRNPTDDSIIPNVQKVEMYTFLPEHLKSYLDAANVRDLLPCSTWSWSADCARVYWSLCKMGRISASGILGYYNAGFTLCACTHTTLQQQNHAAETMGNFMAQVM